MYTLAKTSIGTKDRELGLDIWLRGKDRLSAVVWLELQIDWYGAHLSLHFLWWEIFKLALRKYQFHAYVYAGLLTLAVRVEARWGRYLWPEKLGQGVASL